MTNSTSILRRVLTATIFAAIFGGPTSSTMARVTILPSKPTQDGREFFVVSLGAGQAAIEVNVLNIRATDSILQKATKIANAFNAAGLTARVNAARNGVVVSEKIQAIRWNSHTGEKRDAVKITGASIASYHYDGQPEGMNNDGQPAMYTAGFHGPGFSAEVELSALDLPPQFNADDMVQQLHQQLLMQLPQELHSHVFADPRDRMIGVDTLGLPAQFNQPFEFVWGTDDIGMQMTGDVESFGKRRPDVR